MSSPIVTIGLVQMRPEESAEASLKKAAAMVKEAASKGAQIVALPELFLGPYFCQRPDDRSAFARAEEIPGPATEALSRLAKECSVVLVGGSLFEKSGSTYYNTCPVFEADGTLLGAYRKTHIPEDILYHEQHYFEKGDTGIQVYETSRGKIAPLVCFDQWFPEAARIAALQGAQILVYPTAIGVIDGDVEENVTGDWGQMWRNAQLGHAAANNVYVAALNRAGKEGHIAFWGGSFVAAPSSAVIAQGGKGEEIVMASCDLSRVEALQKAWRFLPNRRPDAYHRLTES
ncbi:MAG: nitrilase-related carbon-nitrogen hydrolase [Patescibacteria group bacterium]